MNYFIYAIIVVGIFTAYMAVVNIFRRDRTQERLPGTLGSEYMDEDDDGAPPLSASFCAGVLSLFGVDVKNQPEITTQLAQAGINSPYAVAYFLFFKRIIQPVFLVIGAIIVFKGMTSTDLTAMNKLLFIMLGGFFAIIGIMGANLYVTNCKQRRQKILMLSFPEALDLMLVCIESGLGLDAALARVCAEMRKTHPEVISELDRTRIELTVLSDRVEALQNLAQRTGIVPFKSLVSALIQSEKFGTSLLDTLRVLSDDMRTTRLMTAENKAARIPVLITLPLVICMLPAFVIIILGPPFIKVAEQGGIFGEKTQSSE
ncbi:MAG: type II secretion system F family protein [Rickettsiales bacterium]